MKKLTFKYLSLMLALLFVLSCISACWMRESYNTRDAFGGVPSESLETEAENEPVADAETETEEVTETEAVSETEAEETTEAETGAVEVVIEENIFGEYVPPEETEAETEAETVQSAPNGGAAYVPTGSGRAPLALMYHLILDEPYSSLESLFVRPSELEGHIQALIEAGYTFIFADEYGYSDEKTVIMSFDDGYLDNYTEMFPIIKKYNVKVTVFMISAYIGGADYLTKDMITEMASSGLVSFQSHTHSHIALDSAGADTMRDEFATSKRILEEITGREVKALCYPSGRYNENAMSVASEYFDFAYTTVSTLSTQGYPAMSLPRFRVSRGLSKAYFASLLP